MRHEGIPPQDGVFVGTEEGESVVQEIIECGFGFAPGDGEASRTVLAEEANALGFPLVKLLPDLGVNVIFHRLPRRWHRQVGFPLGRREPVVVVEIPLSTLRLTVGHEDVVSGSNPPVPVLHQQSLVPATGHPGLKLSGCREPSAFRVDRGQAESFDQSPRRTGCCGDSVKITITRIPMRRNALGVGLGSNKGDPLRILRCTMVQGAEYQVGLLPMVRPALEYRTSLDQQQWTTVIKVRS